MIFIIMNGLRNYPISSKKTENPGFPGFSETNNHKPNYEKTVFHHSPIL
jgi:hypothetical protein